MHVIHRFLLHKCEEMVSHPSARILDYGCGDGEIVLEGRNRGLNIYGVEAFYKGSNSKEVVEAKGLLGNEIKELIEGRIPFPDHYFELVVSNQVLEHIADMNAVLKEIDRVLVPGGTFISLFPSRDVIREGHCGIPFIHWFAKTGRARYHYMLVLRSLGLGYFTGNKSRIQWVLEMLDWLDKYTVYRPYGEISQSFSSFFPTVQRIEDEYLAYRLREDNLTNLAIVIRHPIFHHLARWLYKKLGGLVLSAKSRQKSDPDAYVYEKRPWSS
jgi:SAM-dependent methyltransferase